MNTTEFLKDNPLCIFCGGSVAATERDHIPPRQLFRDRQWPEGYEFPACHPCNAITRNHEQVVSVLTRFFPDSNTAAELDEFQASLSGALNNIKEPLQGLRPTARQVRRTLRDIGMEKDPSLGTWEYPILSVGNPKTRASLGFFSQKLFCALHYKHTKKILPPSAKIVWRWYSNLCASKKEIPEQIFRITPGSPEIKRNKKCLKSQFDYRYGVTKDGDMGSYFASFRLSFALFGVVCFDAQRIPEDVPGHEVVTPIRHSP